MICIDTWHFYGLQVTVVVVSISFLWAIVKIALLEYEIDATEMAEQ